MNRSSKSTQRNPWLTEPASQAEPVAVESRPSYVSVGPVGPHRGSHTAPSGGGIPLWTPNVLPPARWWWVGCHGGAGTTTLHHEVYGGGDSGIRAWPVRPDGGKTHVVLVARTHVRGLNAAQAVARQWAAGGTADNVVLLGLVAVSDAPGRLPKELAEALRFVAGGVPRLWRVPWVEGWRSSTVPNRRPSIRETAQLAADLANLLPVMQESR